MARTITITAGARENGFGGPDGVYEVALVEVGEPHTVTIKNGPAAGTEKDLVDWTFAIGDGEYEGQLVWATTSTASGPKSKMYDYLTALFGGKAPPVGTELDVEKHLIGRRALATIQRDDEGWIKIKNLGALPTRPQPMSAVADQAEPTPKAAVKSIRDQIAANGVPGATAGDDLPF